MTGRLMKLVISIMVRFYDRLNGWARTLTAGDHPASMIILYYHAIPPGQRLRFTRQMDILLQRARPVAAAGETALEAGVHHAAVTFDDGFQSAAENAFPEMQRRGIPATVFVPAGCLGRKPGWLAGLDHEHAGEAVMTAEMLRSLDAAGVSIGSHGMTHTSLMRLGEEDAKHEICGSKAFLEGLLERKITTLSFPHGDFRKSHVEIARRAGYERVFSILPMPAKPGEYVAGRVRVDPTDWFLEFRLKLLGAYRWLPAASLVKARLRGAKSDLFPIRRRDGEEGGLESSSF